MNLDPNAPPCPYTVEDYINWPYQPREGFQAEGNGKYLTKSLFLERAKDDMQHLARYVLREHEVWVPTEQRWVPSAWLIYIYSSNEYDAMRKLVGNPHQWEALKKSAWFPYWFDQWQAEHALLQASLIQQNLMETMKAGGAGSVSAAKQLSDMLGITKPKGRPRKPKEVEAGSTEEDFSAVAERLRLVK